MNGLDATLMQKDDQNRSSDINLRFHLLFLSWKISNDHIIINNNTTKTNEIKFLKCLYCKNCVNADWCIFIKSGVFLMLTMMMMMMMQRLIYKRRYSIHISIYCGDWCGVSKILFFFLTKHEVRRLTLFFNVQQVWLIFFSCDNLIIKVFVFSFCFFFFKGLRRWY